LQKLTQVSNYDIWYLDNFYDDPDHIRNYALSVNYNMDKPNLYPGIRTNEMCKKVCNDEKFYSYFLEELSKKILHFDLDDCLDISTGFHKIPIIDHNLESILNTGYIHVDSLEYRLKYPNRKTFAGLIYLNKVTRSNSGTSFFKMKCTENKNIKINDNNNYKLFNSSFDGYDYEILFDEYVNLYNPLTKRKYWNLFLRNKQFVDSKFEKVIEVENVYNRIVLYDSSYFHTASHFYVNDFEDRLTQPFFIKCYEF